MKRTGETTRSIDVNFKMHENNKNTSSMYMIPVQLLVRKSLIDSLGRPGEVVSMILSSMFRLVCSTSSLASFSSAVLRRNKVLS